MKGTILKFLKSIHHFSSHYLQIIHLFKGFNSPTYTANKNKIKTKFSRLFDYLYLFFILKILPTNYHLFQFDSKDRKHFKEYMDEPTSAFLKHKLYEYFWDDNYSCLVNDKYLFHCFCRYYNIPVPELYGVYRNGVFIGKEKNLKEMMLKNNLKKVILKPMQGIQGKNIHFISANTVDSPITSSPSEDYSAISEDLKKGDYIVQEVIRQHSALNNINPHSVNSIRIITLLSRDGGIEFLAAMLRTSSSHFPIDNFNAGGIVIGIDIKTGALKEKGFFKPYYGTTVAKHPVTHIKFRNFQIPHWEELKKTAAKAQRHFYHLKSIGWDFAVIPDRPIIIEGNIEWGTAGIQATNGGLLTQKNKKLFLQYGLSL